MGAVVLLIYAIVQLALLQGPRPHDPANYFQKAVAFPDLAPNLFSLRIGLIGPVHAAVLLFGPSEAAFYAIPFLTGLVLAGAVYGTMVLLFHDRGLAAAAALVASLNSYFLLNSSFLFPDTTATATFTAAFFFLVLGGMQAQEGNKSWAPTVYVICAGVLLGWTYLVRESSLILFPAVVAAVLLLHYRLRGVVLLAVAAFATFLLEPLYGLLRYGQPLIHARVLAGRGEGSVSAGRASRIDHIQEQLDSLFDTIVVFPRLLVSWSVGWVFLLLVAVFVVALVRLRDRRLWLLAAWCFGLWAIMAVLGLATLPSGHWILNITNIRYWNPIFPPLVMGAFGGAALLLRRSGIGIRGVSLTLPVTAVLAGLALVPGFVEYQRCAADEAWLSDPRARWHDLRSWFETSEARRFDVIWTDLNSRRVLPAFTSTTFGRPLWQGDVEKFASSRRRLVPASDHRRSLLLVHRKNLRTLAPNPSQRLINDLRRDWSPIFASEDGVLVVLRHESAAVGEAPEAAHAWWRLPRFGGDDVTTCRMRPYTRGA